ncbi:MAG: FAD-dependent oxidoreductase, partial [Myxococcota bacterium]
MTQEQDVIVIGAGMSGLSAAHHIYPSNQNLLVLEARDRIGGRLSSEQFEDGLLFERGGELIHGTKNPVYPLVKKLGLADRRVVLLHEPPDFRTKLVDLPETTELLTDYEGSVDVVVVFAKARADFEA